MVTSASLEPGLQADQRLVDRAWLRIGAGLAVAAQAMVFSLAVSITPAEGAGYWVAHRGLMASAWIALILLGRDLVGEAWAAARAGRVSIDLLFLVTLLGALAGSMICSFTGTGAVYYEVVAILIVIHTAGKILGARSRLAALRAVDRTRDLFDRCVGRAGAGKVGLGGLRGYRSRPIPRLARPLRGPSSWPLNWPLKRKKSRSPRTCPTIPADYRTR